MTTKSPPKKHKPSAKSQSKRFTEKVRDLEAAGELSPTDAKEKFERAFKKIVPPKGSPRGPRSP